MFSFCKIGEVSYDAPRAAEKVFAPEIPLVFVDFDTVPEFSPTVFASDLDPVAVAVPPFS